MNISFEGGNNTRVSLFTITAGGEIMDLKVKNSTFSGGSRLAVFVGSALDSQFSKLEVSESLMIINTGGVTGGVVGDCFACNFKSIPARPSYFSI